MAVPLDAIRAIHNAFRKDMEAIDAAAYSAASGRGGLDLISKRYTFFNEVLVWHATGEEESVFPALESVAPLVAEAYERDHRGLDSLFDWLHKAVSVSDVVAIARATAAFNFHLGIHLSKEEAHLYRIFNERVSLPNQGIIMGEMAQKTPQGSGEYDQDLATGLTRAGVCGRQQTYPGGYRKRLGGTSSSDPGTRIADL
jgi:hypothetical protein